ncbi:TIGR03619 family F420-dependent LLM class oxidoreductase [Sphingosinicella terrae]|uniref:TIGR03619 family F420-dependent LLM class oxidoreductase n=1 Tax=Sphingosinicella terrae TaxID=2172047 RepID=UPI000E0D7EC5|nr:TIGR03619 family F420-dependent LLM class oxidoreductase [Sphingosinicella terrae]
MAARTALQLGLSMQGIPDWFGGRIDPAIDQVRLAEDKGFDFVSVPDHVIMSGAIDKYPYGSFPVPPDHPWLEPLTLIAAIAARTTRMRLITAILIAPLRPAVFLAKQIATVDVIANGRLEVGVGVGWQEEEYHAVGIPFDGRFGRLIEAVRAWRALWSEAPASFEGKTVSFRDMYSLPFPVQQGGVPIWLGLAPSERNVDRIAEVADGWLPVHQGDPDQIGAGVAAVREAFVRRGRDPETLKVRGMPQPVQTAGKPDLEATLKQIPDFLRAGVTHLEVTPARWCRNAEEFTDFVDRVVAAVEPFRAGR